MINEILSTIIGGLGLLFIALTFLDANIKSLMTSDVRTVIKKNTSNDYLAIAWGCILGLITGAPAVVGCIAASLYSCRSLTLRKTMIITTWSNLGSWGLYFIVFFNFNFLVLYIIGFTGLAVYLEKPMKWRYYLGTIAAICLMLFAVKLMRSQSENIIEIPWINEHLHAIQSAYFKSYIIAAILTFLTQSDLVIMLLIANLTHAQILTVNQAIFMLYSAQIGVAMTYLFLIFNIKSPMKQMFLLQILFNAGLGLFFTLLLIIEINTSIPMVKALSQHVSHSIWIQMLFIVTFANVLMCILFTLLAEPLSQLMNRICPAIKGKDPSMPRFISMDLISEPASALDLMDQEILALLKKLPKEIEYKLSNQDMDRHQQQITLKLHHEQFKAITKVAEDLLIELGLQNISADISERMFILSDRLQVTLGLEEGIYQLLQIELPENCPKGVKTLSMNIGEAQQALLETILDAIESRDENDINALVESTSGINSTIESIRRSYLKQESSSTVQTKLIILTMTALFERNIWMIRRLIYLYIPKNKIENGEAELLIKG